MRVMIFAESSQYPNCLHIKGLYQAIQQLGLKGDIYDTCHEPVRDRNIKQAIQDMTLTRPDLIISCWPHPFEKGPLHDAIKSCHDQGTKVVWWWGDYHKHFSISIDNDWIDRVYMTNYDEMYWRWVSGHVDIPIEQYRYLPEGSYAYPDRKALDVSFGHPMLQQKCVSFFGNLSAEVYQPRRDLIEALKKQRITVMHFEAFNDEQNRAWLWQPRYWRQAPLMLSMSITNQAPGYTSARLFHMAGSGACILTENFPGLEALYNLGSDFERERPEVYAFTSHGQAVEMAEWLLNKSPEFIQEVGNKAFARTMRDHTITQRVLAILHDLEIDHEWDSSQINVKARAFTWPERRGSAIVR